MNPLFKIKILITISMFIAVVGNAKAETSRGVISNRTNSNSQRFKRNTQTLKGSSFRAQQDGDKLSFSEKALNSLEEETKFFQVNLKSNLNDKEARDNLLNFQCAGGFKINFSDEVSIVLSSHSFLTERAKTRVKNLKGKSVHLSFVFNF